MLHLDKTRTIHTEQGRALGLITPFTDNHGNQRAYTTSPLREDDVLFHTASAATFWLTVVDEIDASRKMRPTADATRPIRAIQPRDYGSKFIPFGQAKKPRKPVDRINIEELDL